MLSYNELGLRRKVTPLDFPTRILDDLKAIDPGFHIIWHEYRVQWDDIINEYTGSLEESRTTIHKEHGETNFGFVYTDGQGAPIPSQSWHIWREVPIHGWAHIIKLEDTHPEYVEKVLNILHNYKTFTEKYGFRSYNTLKAELQGAEREQLIQDQKDYLNAWKAENSWFIRKAAQNLERGIINPSNPQKEIITSFSGQTNKSKIIRPLTEKEGGIINPYGS